MKKILFLILILRPIIDLAWNNRFLGFNIADIVGIVLFVSVIALVLLKNKQLFYPKSFALFLPIVIFSNMAFNNYLYSYALFARLISPMIFLFYFWKDENNLRKIELFMKWFIVVSLIPIILSFLQYFHVIPYTYFDWLPTVGRVGRASGGYGHPTGLTRILIFSILFALYFIHLEKSGRMPKWPLVLYILATLAAIFISYHRAAYFIVVIIFILWYGDISVKYRAKWKMILFFFAMFILALFIISKFSPVKISDVVNLKIISGLHGRVWKFEEITSVYQKMPLLNQLFGNGGNPYFSKGSFMYIDNDAVHMLWSYGIIGLFAWLLVVYEFILSTFRLRNTATLKNYFFNKITRITIVCYILFGVVVETSTLPNFMYIVYSLYVVNNRNIIANCKSDELRTLDSRLVVSGIMAIALSCCILYCFLVSV